MFIKSCCKWIGAGCLVISGLFSSVAFALGEESWLAKNAKSGNFILVGASSKASLYIGETDWPGVKRAAKNLQTDITKVTQQELSLVATAQMLSSSAVIIGTLGKDSLIDQLVAENKIDVSEIEGKWDAFSVQLVKNPLPNVKQALVIVGADKRGTTYGIYSLSEQIGVSPWYWWADVPVKQKKHLFIKNNLHIVDMPTVKYRGIFLNDEAPALTSMVKEKFGDYNAEFYVHVFELLLRLKGNFLWPAMWNSAFADDDVNNMLLADEFGIVMSNSHHEPMMRADKEWNRYGKGAWEYSTNPKELYKFWEEGARRHANYESIFTLGMRGQEDTPMSEGDNVELLETIVRDQRKILSAQFGQENLNKVPQVWALYKEVQGFYERGMRVPDDVILLWCDDNWGNLRRVPTPDERRREGGAGIYYHFDYVGGPRSYKWINSTTTAKIWEQMHIAYTFDANQIWVVNVGDLKPMEYPIEFFLNMAWSPKAWPKERLPEFGVLWAEREFGAKHAKRIAAIVDGYAKHNQRRKPELQDASVYSLLNYREAERVTAEINAFAQEAEAIYQDLAPEYRDAFFQLVLFPTKASANLTAMYYAQAQNLLYAQQGRATANSYAEKVREHFAIDAALTEQYHSLQGGKWNHMASQSHIGYVYWNQPEANTLPMTAQYEPHSAAEMGIAVEGSVQAWPTPGQHRLSFSPYGQQNRFIDIFNRGSQPYNFVAKTTAPWIILDNTSMQVTDNRRINVSIDWRKAPKGEHIEYILVKGPSWGEAKIAVSIFNPNAPKKLRGHIEGDGFVSIEAEHFARTGGNANFTWQVIPQHGRTLSSISPYPLSDFSFEDTSKAPYVEYDFHLWKGGEIAIDYYFAPSLGFVPDRGLRVAVSLNGEAPHIIDLTADNSDKTWEEAVKQDVRILTTSHLKVPAGTQQLRVFMVDSGISLQKIVVNAGGLKPSYLGPEESLRF